MKYYIFIKKIIQCSNYCIGIYILALRSLQVDYIIMEDMSCRLLLQPLNTIIFDINLSSAGTDFRRQNHTSIDVCF